MTTGFSTRRQCLRNNVRASGPAQRQVRRPKTADARVESRAGHSEQTDSRNLRNDLSRPPILNWRSSSNLYRQPTPRRKATFSGIRSTRIQTSEHERKSLRDELDDRMNPHGRGMEIMAYLSSQARSAGSAHPLEDRSSSLKTHRTAGDSFRSSLLSSPHAGRQSHIVQIASDGPFRSHYRAWRQKQGV